MPRHIIRPVRAEGGAAFVSLTQGYTSVIDVEDISKVAGFNWKAKVEPTNVYAVRSVRVAGVNKEIRMHREIFGAGAQEIIDHIDGDSLNNRKSNLRSVTASQNAMNRQRPSTSQPAPKGVTPIRYSGKWQAQICANGQRVYLGTYPTADEAHAAYAAASAELHGEFGRKA